ncbi:hypothetical protein PCANC_19010 [Puccinia coronata f. sp. avenae]|uniref:Uncharacterized protein n=1 Tax=Puccinia coronata f. sp. avenae TaxID=200324 RepID=A0A2N5UH94_9BASI|nr:hypothetical protein PCASD_14700 [Puccinia coronata f. sp. avenae]PLW36401.1 hypothetical protein PCASD_13712 [Puccinia coronata f. sp. avenae]PLW37110.1 hypothetical protein PCANC_19010 [Puccinia coronata f. sp. avenae]
MLPKEASKLIAVSLSLLTLARRIHSRPMVPPYAAGSPPSLMSSQQFVNPQQGYSWTWMNQESDASKTRTAPGRLTPVPLPPGGPGANTRTPGVYGIDRCDYDPYDC